MTKVILSLIFTVKLSLNKNQEILPPMHFYSISFCTASHCNLLTYIRNVTEYEKVFQEVIFLCILFLSYCLVLFCNAKLCWKCHIKFSKHKSLGNHHHHIILKKIKSTLWLGNTSNIMYTLIFYSQDICQQLHFQ